MPVFFSKNDKILASENHTWLAEGEPVLLWEIQSIHENVQNDYYNNNYHNTVVIFSNPIYSVSKFSSLRSKGKVRSATRIIQAI